MLRLVPGTARFGHSNMASGGCGLDDLLRHRARGFAPPRREVWASFAKPGLPPVIVSENLTICHGLCHWIAKIYSLIKQL